MESDLADLSGEAELCLFGQVASEGRRIPSAVTPVTVRPQETWTVWTLIEK
jgi:hypothetical protein